MGREEEKSVHALRLWERVVFLVINNEKELFTEGEVKLTLDILELGSGGACL